MKKIVFFGFVACITLIFSGCKKEEVVEDCEKNNYGIYELTNEFTESVNVYIDGTMKANVKVGEVKKFTLQAGVSYKIRAEEAEYFLFPDDVWDFNISIVKCATVKSRLVQ